MQVLPRSCGVVARLWLLIGAVAVLSPVARAEDVPSQGGELRSVLTLEVDPHQIAELEALAARIIASSLDEPGTLEYEWSLSADGKTLETIERYKNSEAFVTHVNNFSANSFAEPFFKLAKPVRFVVYGKMSEPAKALSAGLNPIVMTTFDGKVRRKSMRK